MSMLPADTRFYMNTWTWGYEDILKAVSHRFQAKVIVVRKSQNPTTDGNPQIHVDRYKYDIYTHLSDASLAFSLTREASTTRFHACERFDRCDVVPKTDKEVVYVNPIRMSNERWMLYFDDTKAKLRAGQQLKHLVCIFFLYWQSDYYLNHHLSYAL